MVNRLIVVWWFRWYYSMLIRLYVSALTAYLEAWPGHYKKKKTYKWQHQIQALMKSQDLLSMSLCQTVREELEATHPKLSLYRFLETLLAYFQRIQAMTNPYQLLLEAFSRMLFIEYVTIRKQWSCFLSRRLPASEWSFILIATSQCHRPFVADGAWHFQIHSLLRQKT